MLNLMMAKRLEGLAALMLSVLISVLDRRPTRARWDGEDWEFKWPGGCLYSDTHRFRPRLATERNFASYLTNYKPAPGDTILEVGAGAGTEVPALSNAVGPDGCIIAIEADPAAFRRLEKQARHLQHQNVSVMQVAASDKDGTIELSVSEPGGLANSTKAQVGGASVQVQARPLDSILEEFGIRKISFMKMNIEGAEYDALVGLGRSIDQIEEMVICCHDFTGIPEQATFRSVGDLLQSHGFKISTLPPSPSCPWRDYFIFATKASELSSGARHE